MNIDNKRFCPTQELGTNQYPIETLAGAFGNEVKVASRRGGHIYEIKLAEKVVTYMEDSTFNNPDRTKSVRGGIPILFPNSGPLTHGENDRYPELMQHGPARRSDKWELESQTNNELILLLKSNEETMRVFPYSFELRVRILTENDGSVTITQEVKNQGDETMPISMGLHPYFKCPRTRKTEIEWNFPGGEIVKKEIDIWMNDGTTDIENPKVKDPSAQIKIKLPDLGELIMDASKEYQRILIWSADPNCEYVCIEPVMRSDNGLNDNPEMVIPGETFIARVNLKLIPEKK